MIGTKRAFAAGEELFIDYGPLCNDVLFVNYGFVLEKNNISCS